MFITIESVLSTGGEPSASALSFAVVLVSQHPDVLQQLLTEIDQVVGKKKEITFDDLSKLQYTEQVKQKKK